MSLTKCKKKKKPIYCVAKEQKESLDIMCRTDRTVLFSPIQMHNRECCGRQTQSNEITLLIYYIYYIFIYGL